MSQRFYLCAFALFATLTISAGGHAQPTARPNETKLLALVIGNANYHSQALRGPDNDARDMAAVLRGIGFTVSNARIVNLTLNEMEEAIREFSAKVDKNTVAVFYYSGHGLEDVRKNYLVPIDAKLTTYADVKRNLVALDSIVDELGRKEARSKIFILDACRNMPMALRYKSVGEQGGLGRISGLRPGMQIIYSASPESVSIAAGPNERNSVFTAGLLKAIEEKHATFSDILSRATQLTLNATDQRQYPWTEGNIGMEFANSVRVQANPFTQTKANLLPAPVADIPTTAKSANCNEISEQVFANGTSTWRKRCG